MDKETEKWYEDQFDLFASPGWKELIVKVDEMYEVYNDASNIQNQERLYKVQGMLEILKWVSTWEDVVNRTYRELSGE